MACKRSIRLEPDRDQQYSSLDARPGSGRRLRAQSRFALRKQPRTSKLAPNESGHLLNVPNESTRHANGLEQNKLPVNRNDFSMKPENARLEKRQSVNCARHESSKRGR